MTLENITIGIILIALSFLSASIICLWIGFWDVPGLAYPHHEEFCRICALISLAAAIIFIVLLAIIYHYYKSVIDISYIKSWFGFTDSGVVWF